MGISFLDNLQGKNIISHKNCWSPPISTVLSIQHELKESIQSHWQVEGCGLAAVLSKCQEMLTVSVFLSLILLLFFSSPPW